MNNDKNTGMHCPDCGADIMETPNKDQYCKFVCGWSMTDDERISGKIGRPNSRPYARDFPIPNPKKGK